MLFQKWDAASSEESKAQPWTNCLQTNPLPLELIARLGLELTENQLPLLKTNQTKPHPHPPKNTQTKPNFHQTKNKTNHDYKEFLSIKLIQASDKIVTAANWYGNKQ